MDNKIKLDLFNQIILDNPKLSILNEIKQQWGLLFNQNLVIKEQAFPTSISDKSVLTISVSDYINYNYDTDYKLIIQNMINLYFASDDFFYFRWVRRC